MDKEKRQSEYRGGEKKCKSTQTQKKKRSNISKGVAASFVDRHKKKKGRDRTCGRNSEELKSAPTS